MSPPFFFLVEVLIVCRLGGGVTLLAAQFALQHSHWLRGDKTTSRTRHAESFHALSGCSSPSAHTVPGACLPCPKQRFLDFCLTSWKCHAVSRRNRAIKLRRWPPAALRTKLGTYFTAKGTKFVHSLEFRRARRWSCIFYRKCKHAGLSGTFVERIFAYNSAYAAGLMPVSVQFSPGLWRWQDGVEKPACQANGALPYFE